LFGEINGGRDADEPSTSAAGTTRTVTRTPPAFLTVLGVLMLPFVLISFNTVLDTLMTAGVIEEAPHGRSTSSCSGTRRSHC
jgi:gluconate:H+ symporter, GntP family